MTSPRGLLRVLGSGRGPRRAGTALLLLVAPFAGLADAAVLAGPACAAAPADVVVVAVVIDFGDGVSVACVPVRDSSTGADVLAARARQLGTPPPRYESSGLLCGIDGRPATGCGTHTDTRYAYWAYFHGGGSWAYASSGPGSWRVRSGSVEGWRFEPDGSGTPSDPPPRASSSHDALCSPVPSTTIPATTTPTAPPPTAPSGSTTVPSTPGGPQTTRSGVGTTSPGSGATAAPGIPASTTLAGDPIIASVPDATGTSRLESTTDAGSGGDPSDAKGGASKGDGLPLAAARAGSSAPGGGNAGRGGAGGTLGAFAAAMLVVGLGGGAWWKSRRSRDT